ncbi:hypothetical protein BL240_05850 [Pseudomonas putida]|uniref:Uncharacterized protein n=1 Tax=Pseudomonas putida TaxID=303 RepID=A0A1L5PLH2_PSEPU|nr:hypothetical protein BL240_05850 [Pseudomonas putida]
MVRKRDAASVGAGEPAKNPTRWLAPAAPVFAGTPAPTDTAAFVRLPPLQQLHRLVEHRQRLRRLMDIRRQ